MFHLFLVFLSSSPAPFPSISFLPLFLSLICPSIPSIYLFFIFLLSYSFYSVIRAPKKVPFCSGYGSVLLHHNKKGHRKERESEKRLLFLINEISSIRITSNLLRPFWGKSIIKRDLRAHPNKNFEFVSTPLIPVPLRLRSPRPLTRSSPAITVSPFPPPADDDHPANVVNWLSGSKGFYEVVVRLVVVTWMPTCGPRHCHIF